MINRLFINSYYYNQSYKCNDCSKIETGTDIHNGGIEINDDRLKFSYLVKWNLLSENMPEGWTYKMKNSGYSFHCGCEPKQKGEGIPNNGELNMKMRNKNDKPYTFHEYMVKVQKAKVIGGGLDWLEPMADSYGMDYAKYCLLNYLNPCDLNRIVRRQISKQLFNVPWQKPKGFLSWFTKKG